MGRTEADRQITNEPWSSMQRVKRANKTTHKSEWRVALKKDLTEPTLLEMSGNPTTQPSEDNGALPRLPRSVSSHQLMRIPGHTDVVGTGLLTTRGTQQEIWNRNSLFPAESFAVKTQNILR